MEKYIYIHIAHDKITIESNYDKITGVSKLKQENIKTIQRIFKHTEKINTDLSILIWSINITTPITAGNAYLFTEHKFLAHIENESNELHHLLKKYLI